MSDLSWKLGDVHETYGEVVGLAVIQGEPYRFFEDKDGGIAMMPLDLLIEPSAKRKQGSI